MVDESERLKTLYAPTPDAYVKALQVLNFLGHRTAAAWTRFNLDDDPSILCRNCNTAYVLGGSYGAPVYYLNVRSKTAGGEIFDAAVVLSFDHVAASELSARHLAKWIPPHFYCKKVESFL